MIIQSVQLNAPTKDTIREVDYATSGVAVRASYSSARS